MAKTNEEKLIKSKERVHKFAEVFTPKHIVKQMCDCLGDEAWNDPFKTFLEPSCGTGNFLVEILERKLKLCKDEREGLKALNSIFGIEIQQDNVEECKARLLEVYLQHFPQSSEATIALAVGILNNRIIRDDFLNPQTEIVKSWGITPSEDYLKYLERKKKNANGRKSKENNNRHSKNS